MNHPQILRFPSERNSVTLHNINTQESESALLSVPVHSEEVVRNDSSHKLHQTRIKTSFPEFPPRDSVSNAQQLTQLKGFRFALALLLLGFIGNEYLVGAVLSADGQIQSLSTLFTLRMMQFTFVLTGLCVITLQRNRRSIFAKCCLMVAFFTGSLAIAEGFLKSTGLAPPIKSGWRGTHAAEEMNEFGFRGHPVAYEEKDFVVVLLGDSQVEARACAYEMMPEVILKNSLQERIGNQRKIQVVSLGAGGYGQDQQLLALREYFESGHRADLVILWQTMINNIWNNTFPTHWPTNATPKPTFVLEDGELSEQPFFRETTQPSDVHLLRLLGSLKYRRLDDTWEREVLPPPYQPLKGESIPKSEEWQAELERHIAFGDNFASDKNHVSMWLSPRSPRVEYGIQLTRALISTIKR